MASLINDVFQLLRIPKKVSYFEAAILMKILDADGNSMISKQEAYDAVTGALAKFGGIGGLAQFAGFKVGSGIPSNPNDIIKD